MRIASELKDKVSALGLAIAAAKGASDKAVADASDRAKKDAERIQRIEQQLEDQKKANARSLLDLQTQLADVKASLETRAALAEKERDAAREDTATLVRAQRDLLDAVRAQRAAVQELIRAAEAALAAKKVPAAPRADS
jgi:chromosome segregation ATPase